MILSSLPLHESSMVADDLNVQIGADDHSWPRVLGQNDNDSGVADTSGPTPYLYATHAGTLFPPANGEVENVWTSEVTVFYLSRSAFVWQQLEEQSAERKRPVWYREFEGSRHSRGVPDGNQQRSKFVFMHDVTIPQNSQLFYYRLKEGIVDAADKAIGFSSRKTKQP
ncbi:unnamed protein product [Soboliphyme baturini]|uniref:DPPIV_N domain-containing protein n=1 Tax=Soboliphyme baturini TaxID=241478 RepID=A0A183IHP9_9BILA|nr:unnamed protein product [Soboliphyme baturini]